MVMNRSEHSPVPRGESTAAESATRKHKLAALAESSEAQAANGRLLEDIVHDHATEFPEWEIERCWRWSEWPRRADFGLPLHDYGIDLVAETVTGRTVAIQCKARGGGGSVTPREIREFAGAAKKHYDECWIVTNAHQGSGAAEALQTSGVIWKDIAAEDAAITEGAADEPDDDPRTAMQDEAVKACVHALKHPQADLEEKWAADSADVPVLEGVAPVSRTKLILPCGTGKTRTAARIVDELTGDGDLAVILTPSISLVGQTRSAVLRHFRSAGRRTASIVVCSDKTAGHVSEDEHAAAETGARKPTELDATTDSGQVRAADLGCRTASSGDEVAEWIGARGRGSRLNLIVGTYQSAHHVAEGLKAAGVAARILVCDEAHRTAQIRPPKGKKAAERAANFTCCHEQAILPTQYRLYLTATPRVYPYDNNKVERARAKGYLVASMDDESIFGTEGYRISYPAAVDRELLSDYRIIAFTTNRDTWKTAERIAKRQDGLRVTEAVTWLTYGIVLYGGAMDGARQVDIRSSIAFLNRTDKSRRLANWLKSELGQKEITEYLKRRGLVPRPERPTVEHLDAADSAKARRGALDNLASATTEQSHGVCNVAIFGEGTDTPSLNAVAMLAPRRSPTDVIQIVGRCMRRDPMKTTGYVIVPVTLPPDIDAETSLGMETLDEAWEPLGQILSALRAHDGRVEDRVAHLLTICEPSDDPAEPTPEVHAPVEAKDGPVFRRGIWSGAKAGDLEHIIAETDCGEYSRDRPDIRAFLTAERGFTWGDEPTANSRRVPTDLTGNRAEDEQRVHNAPIALAINRTRRKTPEIATYKPVGPKTEDGAEGPSTAGRSVGIAETLTEGRKRIRENRLRPPRRRRQIEQQTMEPRLWRTLAARDLAVEVMEKSGLRGNETRDFNILQEPLRDAAESLRNEGLGGSLRALLRMPEIAVDAGKKDAKAADACMVAAILMLNAVMLHARMEHTSGRIRKLIGTSTLESALNAENPLARLAEAWVSIMSHDYAALFSPALRVVKHLRDSERRHAGQAAARRLAAWGRDNAEHYTSMNMEYAGELFARVMGQQQAHGAYFTRPEAARLLAELAADEVGIADWSDPASWTKLKAADLACGSGTLLNAWIETCKARIRASGRNDEEVRKFHRKAVEELAVGLDINPITLQMAAGRFLIGDTGLDYRAMNLFEVEHGYNDSGELRLGTLELLGEDEVIGAAPETFKWEDDDIVDPDIKSALKDTRVVIMNPPFSSNQARNTNQDSETRRAFQERELRLRDRMKATDPDAGAVIDANSIRTFFTPLAEAVLPKTRTGILAKVIPMTGLTAASGEKERQLLADRFQIRCIVMCHDPKNIHLSQDTAINEALLIGRRTTDGRGTTEPTTFVNLRRYPRSETEATKMAEAIKSGEWNEVGTACEWPAKRMRDGDWSAGQWYEPELANGATRLKEKPEMKTAAELYTFGPPGQRSQDTFEETPDGEERDDDVVMFNSINESQRRRLAGVGDQRCRVRPPQRRGRRMSEKLFAKYRDSAAHIVVAQRFRTTSSRTTAQYSGVPALGTAYIPLKTPRRAEAKALNLLWNSTPVLLQLLNMRSKTASYPKWSVSQLGSVRLPDIQGDSDAVRCLARTHDELAADELSRLSEAHACPTRAAIDAAAAPLFGLDEATVAEWRRLLAAEPLMHNQMPDETFEE